MCCKSLLSGFQPCQLKQRVKTPLVQPSPLSQCSLCSAHTPSFNGKLYLQSQKAFQKATKKAAKGNNTLKQLPSKMYTPAP